MKIFVIVGAREGRLSFSKLALTGRLLSLNIVEIMSTFQRFLVIVLLTILLGIKMLQFSQYCFKNQMPQEIVLFSHLSLSVNV